jgi:hypothetical protein
MSTILDRALDQDRRTHCRATDPPRAPIRRFRVKLAYTCGLTASIVTDADDLAGAIKRAMYRADYWGNHVRAVLYACELPA